jgi:4-hydroxy-4-methyl-2-oxoglutarate aldolase
MNVLFNKYFKNEFLSEYCSGIFSDELDKMGYRNQVINEWKLNKISNRVFGKVRTMTIETIETPDENIKKGLGFLGSLKEGEVLFVKGSQDFAYFGELMSRLSVEVGLSGAIIDGLTRDTNYTQNINFPIFAKGYSPKDIKGRGRVDKIDVLIYVDDIRIKSGDYIFGDSDAIVVIPEEIFSDLVPLINRAVEEEAGIKMMIAKGKSISEILEVAKEF